MLVNSKYSGIKTCLRVFLYMKVQELWTRSLDTIFNYSKSLTMLKHKRNLKKNLNRCGDSITHNELVKMHTWVFIGYVLDLYWDHIKQLWIYWYD